jgi:hypothetical protein
MGVDLGDPAVLADELAATVARLHERLDAIAPAEVARRVGANLMHRTRPAPLGPLAQLALADRLAADTVLRLRPELRVRTEVDDAELRLLLVDRTIRLPAAAADAVKLALAGSPLTPADLPGLDPAQQLDVARQLVRAGVLVAG